MIFLWSDPQKAGRYLMKKNSTGSTQFILENDSVPQVVKAFAEYLKTSDDTPQKLYPAAIKVVKEKTNSKGKELFMPIRAALTGKVHGPELDKVFAILGKEAALKRLTHFNS